MRLSLLLLATLSLASSSPLEASEEYIQEFKAGIENVKKHAAEYSFEEEDFDSVVHNKSEIIQDETKYDFVIIGAGASGSVIANRLSEKPEWKVLVLEAGAPETEYTKIPKYGHLLQNSDYNWGYVTTPQKNWCKGMIDNRCAIAGGKALGGGTAINGMLYTRGNPKDYDLWADLGNDGWCYDDVLPYFKKAEDADLQRFDNKFHNRGGPFHVEHPQYLTELAQSALNAGKELGLEVVDYNGKEQLGLGIAQINSKYGKRQSTAEAYLESASDRKNLVVKPNSHVIKILFSPHTKEARGVQYVQGHKIYEVKAEKEVIVSAGAINTAQLLKLSGIGPKEELDKLGIPIVQDLQVGHNFKDHIGFLSLDFILKENKLKEEDNQVSDYLKHGKGPLTTTGCEVIAYIQTPTSKTQSKYPDIELFFSTKTISTTPLINPFRIKHEIFASQWKDLDSKDAINIGVMLAHPKSTGTVTLKDKDPFHSPAVDPNQFSDPDDEDVATMVAGIRSAAKLAKTEALKKWNVEINENKIKGCEEHDWDSDGYWKCAVKHLSVSLRHVTGTAKMGPKDDKSAVVDNKLFVYGVHKLRVADCSVVPVTVAAHTMAPAIMIGEKAADLIKETWK